MTEKNQIIITDLKFQINNFKGTGNDYDVQVYTQDETENDMYTVEILDVNDNKCERVGMFYIDSCGNYSCEEGFDMTEIEQFVMNMLFVPQMQSIIKGF